jgi:hypothetical protein
VTTEQTKDLGMTKLDRYPSYAACVAHALSTSRQPLSVDILLTKVGGQRPLGKGARSAVYRAIGQLFQAVPVGPGRYGWLTHLLAGSVFRHPLTSEEARRGFLLLDELEHIVFFPQFFQANRPEERTLTIELFGGPAIQAEASIERKTWSLQLGPEFSAWFEEQGGQSKDDLLISVTDAEAGFYQMRLNLREMRDERAIRHRNIQLALLAEELVAEDRRTRPAMPTWELVARLIGRGFFNEQPAADDLHYVLHEYSMLRFRDGLGYQLEVSDEAEDYQSRRQLAYTLSMESDEADYTVIAPEEFHDSHWDGAATAGVPADILNDDEHCASYQSYLDNFQIVEPDGEALSHDDFHLLEAELEMLVRLEQEFGHLLRDQEERKEYLAALLFIDPDEFLENGWDGSDDPDGATPPFWSN